MLVRAAAALLSTGALLALLLQPTRTMAQNSSSATATTAQQLNGWYSCSQYTFADEGSSPSDAECAVYTAPLCYPGVCMDAKARTVEIFIKRIPAVANADTAPNVWFLQGGPGAGSTAMESAMVTFHEQLNGKVNVYTMDHRGTGRSTLLNCVAAQATMSGSPSGGEVTVSEVPSCAKDFEVKYGNLSAFSITSAATDVSTVITQFQNSTGKTFVYGVSYGTALVERLMHLQNSAIAGYILDGIATASGSDPKRFEYFSTWDADYGEVGAHYLSFCDKDSACAARFPGSSLAKVLANVLARFDAKPESTCAALVRDTTSGAPGEEAEPASHTVRKALGSLFESSNSRTLIPALAYRLNRCNVADVGVLTHFFNMSSSGLTPEYEDSAFESTLLYNLIVFSEMWESPTPSVATMLQRFTDTIICNGGTASSVETYCAFSKEVSDTCNTLKVANYTGAPLTYTKDKYWNVAATVPSTASVLLLSSKMDPQTPHKYATYLLEALKSSAKELVTFEHATHGTLWTTPLSASDSDGKDTTCGMRLLISYVTNGGDLSKLDKSCVAQMPPLSFAVDEDAVIELFSTTDAFNGEFDPSLSDASGSDGSEKDTRSFKGAFIAFLVVSVIAISAAALFAFGWYRQRQRARDKVGSSSVQSNPSTGIDVSDSSPTTVFQSGRPQA